MWISWKHQDTDFTGPLPFEQKVEVFYEQTLGWQLHIADLVANGGRTFGEEKPVQAIRHSGFAVLHICLSYFELIGSLVSSRQQSPTAAFKSGVQRVLPDLIDGSPESAPLLARLHEGARCGLYHEGRTRPGVGLGRPPGGRPIAYDSRTHTLVISPERLPRAFKAHLEQFRRELLNPANAELRTVFERRFDAGFTQTRPLLNEAMQPTNRADPKRKSWWSSRAARG